MDTWEDVANELTTRHPTAKVEDGRLRLRLHARGADRAVRLVACATAEAGQVLIVATIGPAIGHEDLVRVHTALQRPTTLFAYRDELLLRIVVPLDQVERRLHLIASEAAQLQAKLGARRPRSARPAFDCFAGYVE